MFSVSLNMWHVICIYELLWSLVKDEFCRCQKLIIESIKKTIIFSSPDLLLVVLYCCVLLMNPCAADWVLSVETICLKDCYFCRNHTFVRFLAAPSVTQTPALSGSTSKRFTAQRHMSPRSIAATYHPDHRQPKRMERTSQGAKRGFRGINRIQGTARPEVWRTTCTSNPSRLKTLWWEHDFSLVSLTCNLWDYYLTWIIQSKLNHLFDASLLSNVPYGQSLLRWAHMQHFIIVHNFMPYFKFIQYFVH